MLSLRSTLRDKSVNATSDHIQDLTTYGVLQSTDVQSTPYLTRKFSSFCHRAFSSLSFYSQRQNESYISDTVTDNEGDS